MREHFMEWSQLIDAEPNLDAFLSRPFDLAAQLRRE
jgi:hypothetical protein